MGFFHFPDDGLKECQMLKLHSGTPFGKWQVIFGSSEKASGEKASGEGSAVEVVIW